jgi:hypothetical protein
MPVKTEVIQTVDGPANVEYWWSEDFAGRVTTIITSRECERIPVPDDFIVCDFCNADIVNWPCAVLRGTDALCPECLEKIKLK